MTDVDVLSFDCRVSWRQFVGSSKRTFAFTDVFNFVLLNKKFANLPSIKLKVNPESKVQWWKPCDGKYFQFTTALAHSDISWEHFPGDLNDKLSPRAWSWSSFHHHYSYTSVSPAVHHTGMPFVFVSLSSTGFCGYSLILLSKRRGE